MTTMTTKTKTSTTSSRSKALIGLLSVEVGSESCKAYYEDKSNNRRSLCPTFASPRPWGYDGLTVYAFNDCEIPLIPLSARVLWTVVAVFLLAYILTCTALLDAFSATRYELNEMHAGMATM